VKISNKQWASCLDELGNLLKTLPYSRDVAGLLPHERLHSSLTLEHAPASVGGGVPLTTTAPPKLMAGAEHGTTGRRILGRTEKRGNTTATYPHRWMASSDDDDRSTRVASTFGG
jgi:hypothetical protein